MQKKDRYYTHVQLLILFQRMPIYRVLGTTKRKLLKFSDVGWVVRALSPKTPRGRQLDLVD